MSVAVASAAPAPPKRSVIALGLAVIGLAASVASLIDYLGASATFCAESGCNQVRESAWAHPLGVPMPVLGIAFFLAAIVLCFAAAPRLRLALALAGGAWAAFLIGLQAFSIGAWCKLCMVADPAALGYLVAVLVGAGAIRFSIGYVFGLVPGFGVAVAALALIASATPPPDAEATTAAASGVPAFVRQAQVPGKVTIVDFVDFECPFCRRMNTRLESAMVRATHEINMVRKMFPLSIHPHARTAALAYCCADAQGKGNEMAAALFAAPPEELTVEGCEKLALSIGCDLDRFRQSMAAASERVERETAEARAASINSLPTLFVGTERVVGAGKSEDELAALINRTAITP
ncbi:MAG TPA: vitamin K epoxide reductase family protein [Kofleriaceae bacterium]|nr:vitamin K epoxide reductase family protein [Kofleriaceae bacterium]